MRKLVCGEILVLLRISSALEVGSIGSNPNLEWLMPQSPRQARRTAGSEDANTHQHRELNAVYRLTITSFGRLTYLVPSRDKFLCA